MFIESVKKQTKTTGSLSTGLLGKKQHFLCYKIIVDIIGESDWKAPRPVLQLKKPWVRNPEEMKAHTVI